VIQSRNRGVIEGGENEVKSIVDHLSDYKMGTRVVRERPIDEAAAKRKAEKAQAKESKRARLDAPLADGVTYRPKTAETKRAYELLLDFVRDKFGDQPEDVMKAGAEEVLIVLKDESFTETSRKAALEAVVGPVTEDSLSKVIAVGKAITDFVPLSSSAGAETARGDGTTDEYGVAVVFEDGDDEDEDSKDGMVRDEASDDGDDDGVEADADTAFGEGKAEPGDGGQAPGGEDVAMDGAHTSGKRSGDSVSPRDVDAYWLQRTLSSYYPDAVEAQAVAKEVLGMLAASCSERECENALVGLLDFDKFDLVKLLLTNRHTIAFCTRLLQAQSDQERASIEAEMLADARFSDILKSLRGGDKKEDPAASSKRAAAASATSTATTTTTTAASAAAEAGASSGRRILNLEAMAFEQGGHLMSNKKVEIPGSFLTQKPGWEEVHVPPTVVKVPEGEVFVKVAEMPKWAQPAFKGIEKLNRIQSKTYQFAMFSGDNMLLCAPTGAGKTNVALMTILHEIGLHIDPATGDVDRKAFKIVYIAPMKALVQEMVGSFSKRLEPLGIVVKELTGDMNLTKEQIAETQIIVTTPEKWDIITRKAGERTYTQLVRLVIIDEIHLLHDGRGPVLESLVARTIRQIETTQEMIRIVGLSATLPNYEDVRLLLRVKEGLFFFDSTYRPVPLEQIFVGITEKKPLRRHALANEITYEKTMEQVGTAQVLVFVHSRKETAKTARYIRDQAVAKDQIGTFIREASTRKILKAELEREGKGAVLSAELRDLLPYGIGIHHAGMARSDRTLVEDLFFNKHLQVLVSTATLAWGVNLPAHQVIIKGTQVYSPEKGRWVELSFLDIMQMIGRAGRPGFDTKGRGIIITTHQELQYYLSLFNSQLPIESQLVARLPDQLNAEIVMGSVSSIDDAVRWLSYTYLYIRMMRNPRLYGISPDAVRDDPDLERFRADLAHTAATVLDKANLIRYDRRTGALLSTDLGRVASHYYVAHESMRVYNEHLKPTMSDIDLLRLFAMSGEFKYVSVREEEKTELAKLLERVPIPVKEGLEEKTAKVNVLLQAYISQLKLEGLTLASDMIFVEQSAGRLFRAIFELVIRRGWATLAEKTLGFCRMVERRAWSSMSPLRQFHGLVPDEIVRRIENKDLPFDRLFDLSATELGDLVRTPAVGKKLHKAIHEFPRLELRAEVQPLTRSLLRVELQITPDFMWDDKVHGGAETFWVIVSDVDGEAVLHFEQFILKKRYLADTHVLTFTVAVLEPVPPQYFVRLLSERWLGCDQTLPISFRHLILPDKFPPPSQLLDLLPMPVPALANGYSALFPFRTFNPVQTMLFGPAFNSGGNLLLCAPTGSGKTAVAELAIFRAWSLAEKHGTRARVVYVAATDAIVGTRALDWRKFESVGKRVVALTGETQTDLKLLEEGDIVLSTAERWDMMSRRWKQRKNVQGVSLLIADEVQLIGSSKGPTLEVVLSRARYMSSQGFACRIVALGSPLANARDLGEWLGCASGDIFNFSPSVRPVPLEIMLSGFDVSHVPSRILAMARPAYAAVLKHVGSSGAPALVFVPSRRQARLTAVDFCSFAAGDNEPLRFLRRGPPPDKALDRVKDAALRETLASGVAFLHEDLTAAERKVVLDLFGSGVAQVLVASQAQCWSVAPAAPAQLVVIMDTQTFDGREHRYVDYAVTDVLQMVGLAGRPGQDSSGRCVLLTETGKKEYYKRFLTEPLPVESHLDHFLANHFNAEIVTKTIENKQDAVDYLTWTFLYRRLTKNPNYYGLTGVTHRHLSDSLSVLVEKTLQHLEESHCINVQDEMDLAPLNLGMIASHYYIQYYTVDVFSSSIKENTRFKALLSVLAAASEFDSLAVRHKEDHQIAQLAAHLPVKIEQPTWNDPHTKVNVLLQCHLSRRQLPLDLKADQAALLLDVPRLLQACVDVIGSHGWLTPALDCMELAQSVVQAVWARASPLLQVPGFTEPLVKRLQEAGCEGVFDLMELDDKKRNRLLDGFTPAQMSAVARFCNRYPNLEIKFKVEGEDGSNRVTAGSEDGGAAVTVTLARDEDADLGPVIAPYFPKADKEEAWWVFVGRPEANELLSIKRVVVGKQATVKLEVPAPAQPGKHTYSLYAMCDSYVGADQHFTFELQATAAMEE
jgi:pre-mRNA-splicing helicase BRR2